MKEHTMQSMQKLPHPGKATNSESGFTILETAISLVLMAIVGLGIASVFYYVVRNTGSAGDRDLAMAVGQQRVEQLRNEAFAATSLNATSTSGTAATVVRAGRSYLVNTIITDSNVIDGRATIKTITIRVTPQNDGSSWASSVSSLFGSVTLVSQRTALTVGPNRAL